MCRRQCARCSVAFADMQGDETGMGVQNQAVCCINEIFRESNAGPAAQRRCLHCHHSHNDIEASHLSLQACYPPHWRCLRQRWQAQALETLMMASRAAAAAARRRRHDSQVPRWPLPAIRRPRLAHCFAYRSVDCYRRRASCAVAALPLLLLAWLAPQRLRCLPQQNAPPATRQRWRLPRPR